MSRFAAPIAEAIWDMKYRFKQADGTLIDANVEDTWSRIAGLWRGRGDTRGVGAEEDALRDFRFLPAGRITAGRVRSLVTLFNCFVMGTIPDSMAGIFEMLKEAALTMQQGGGIGYDFSTIRPNGGVEGGGGCAGPLHSWMSGIDVPHHHVCRFAARGDDGLYALRSPRC